MEEADLYDDILGGTLSPSRVPCVEALLEIGVHRRVLRLPEGCSPLQAVREVATRLLSGDAGLRDAVGKTRLVFQRRSLKFDTWVDIESAGERPVADGELLRALSVVPVVPVASVAPTRPARPARPARPVRPVVPARPAREAGEVVTSDSEAAEDQDRRRRSEDKRRHRKRRHRSGSADGDRRRHRRHRRHRRSRDTKRSSSRGSSSAVSEDSEEEDRRRKRSSRKERHSHAHRRRNRSRSRSSSSHSDSGRSRSARRSRSVGDSSSGGGGGGRKRNSSARRRNSSSSSSNSRGGGGGLKKSSSARKRNRSSSSGSSSGGGGGGLKKNSSARTRRTSSSSSSSGAGGSLKRTSSAKRRNSNSSGGGGGGGGGLKKSSSARKRTSSSSPRRRRSSPPSSGPRRIAPARPAPPPAGSGAAAWQHMDPDFADELRKYELDRARRQGQEELRRHLSDLADISEDELSSSAPDTPKKRDREEERGGEKGTGKAMDLTDLGQRVLDRLKKLREEHGGGDGARRSTGEKTKRKDDRSGKTESRERRDPDIPEPTHSRGGRVYAGYLNLDGKNPVMALHEYCTARLWKAPCFQLTEKPSDNKKLRLFTAAVKVNEKMYTMTELVQNKKDGKRSVALYCLQKLGVLRQDKGVDLGQISLP